MKSQVKNNSYSFDQILGLEGFTDLIEIFVSKMNLFHYPCCLFITKLFILSEPQFLHLKK